MIFEDHWDVVADTFCGKGGSSRVWAVKNVRYLLIRGLAQGTVGMGLMLPVEELVTNTDGACTKFQVPTTKTEREPLDSFRTWFPINLGARGDRDIMMGFPIALDLRLKEGFITLLQNKSRLLEM